MIRQLTLPPPPDAQIGAVLPAQPETYRILAIYFDITPQLAGAHVLLNYVFGGVATVMQVPTPTLNAGNGNAVSFIAGVQAASVPNSAGGVTVTAPVPPIPITPQTTVRLVTDSSDPTDVWSGIGILIDDEPLPRYG